MAATGGNLGGDPTPHLDTARGELDLVVPDLAARSFVDAATHLAAANAAIDQAVRVVAGPPLPDGGGPLEDLLRARIGWSAVAPKGLALRLGLPSPVPGVKLVGGALVYTLT